jgi:hypothetical protein
VDDLNYLQERSIDDVRDEDSSSDAISPWMRTDTPWVEPTDAAYVSNRPR